MMNKLHNNYTLCNFKQVPKTSATGWASLAITSILNLNPLLFCHNSIPMYKSQKFYHSNLLREVVIVNKCFRFSMKKEGQQKFKANQSQLSQNSSKKQVKKVEHRGLHSTSIRIANRQQCKKVRYSSNGEDKAVKL